MWSAFSDWFHAPFNSNMSTVGWFWFLGLLIVLVAIWHLILLHIREGAL